MNTFRKNLYTRYVIISEHCLLEYERPKRDIEENTSITQLSTKADFPKRFPSLKGI